MPIPNLADLIPDNGDGNKKARQQSPSGIPDLASMIPDSNNVGGPSNISQLPVADPNSPTNLENIASDTNEPLWKQLALSAAQATISPFQGIAHVASRVTGFKSLSNISDKIDQFVAGITPGVDENNPNLSAAAQALGTVGGTVLGTGETFKGAQAIAKGGALLGEKIAPQLSARILTRIAETGRYVQEVASQFVDPQIAANLGTATTKLPLNLAAGLGLQAATDPESLKSVTGLATGIGFAGLGAIMETKAMHPGARNIAATPKEIDPSLPTYSQNIQRAIQGPQDVDIPNVRAALSELYTNTIDRQYPLKEFEKQIAKDPTQGGTIAGTTALPNYQLPSAIAQLTNGTNGRIDTFLHDQPFLINWDSGETIPDPTTPAMAKILRDYAPTKSAQDALDRLLLAQRSTDTRITANNVQLPSSFNINDAVAEIANADPSIQKAADGIRANVKAARRYAEISGGGMMDSQTAQLWDIDSPNYIPLYRAVEKIMDPGLKPIDNTFGPGKLVRKLFGSERDVRSPISNVKDLITSTIKASDRNMIGQKLMTLISNMTDSEQEQFGVKVLSPADKWHNPEFYDKAEQLRKEALTMGYALSDIQAQKLTSVFGKMFDPTSNILTVQTPGGLQRLQLNNELAGVYKSMSPQQYPWWQQLLSVPAKTLKTGITAALDFSGANFLRDSWDATLQSKYGFRLGVDSWKGLLESLRDGPMRQEWMQAGGGYGDVGRIGQINPNNVFHDIRPATTLQNVGKVFMHPLDALKELARPFEEAARIGEYMRGREQGASAIEAALASRNVTTDFAKIGAHMHALSQMTAFLNPALQSLDQNFKTIGSKPGAVASKGIAALTIPSALLWFANKDDQQINDLRKTQEGSNYWFFRLHGGDIGRIPKPFLYGQLFGTSIETALDRAYQNDKQSVDRLGAGIVNQVAMNVVPNAVTLPYQLWANKDQFTGSTIIPASLKNVDPQYQTINSTSDAAKYIATYMYQVSGGKINVSPMHIDWLARNVGGNIGRDVMGMTKPSEEKDLADYPFFHRWVAKYPSMNVEPVQTFYNQADKINTVVGTVNNLTKNGNVEELNKYLSAHANEMAYSSIYAETQKQLKDIRDAISQIQNLPNNTLESQRKKEMIQYLITQSIEITRAVNKSVNDIN